MSQCLVCGHNEISPILEVSDYSISNETFHIHQCDHCGFRFTANPPLEEACGKYYQDEKYISHSNTSKGIVAKLYHQVRYIMLRRKHQLITKISNGTKVLDVGSGTGYFLNHLKSNGYQVQGVEMSDSARTFSIHEFGINVVKSIDDIEKHQKFDCITLWHVLEHLYNPNKYMQRFRELLDTHGTLVIALPNHQSFDANKYNTYWAAYDVPRHLWHFNPSTLSSFAQNNGFKVTQKYMMPFDPFYNSILSEKYKNNQFGLIAGFWNGLKAYFTGLKSVDHASSVIYILKPIQN